MPFVLMVTRTAVVLLTGLRGVHQAELRDESGWRWAEWGVGYDASEVEDGEVRPLIAMQA